MINDRISSMEQNGPPPAAAGTLYLGKVMHQRLSPFGHRFSYSVFSLLVDVDRLSELGTVSILLAVNRSGILSFQERDHVELEGETLRQFADRLLVRAGLIKPVARVLLLAYPRMLGYVFNPISTYFAYSDDGELVAIIYAVRNTFGERHSYVARLLPGELSPAGVRQSRTKLFHVSPFMKMDMRYHFRVLPPGKSIKLRIHETAGDIPMLAATFSGKGVTLDTGNLIRCLMHFPLMTLKVMAGIHWEALKLWLKGARFHSSPPPPESTSFRDEDHLQSKREASRATKFASSRKRATVSE